MVDALRVAGGDGRLTAEELDARLERALSARTLGELAELTADLPGTLAARDVLVVGQHGGRYVTEGRNPAAGRARSDDRPDTSRCSTASSMRGRSFAPAPPPAHPAATRQHPSPRPRQPRQSRSTANTPVSPKSRTTPGVSTAAVTTLRAPSATRFPATYLGAVLQVAYLQ